MVLVVELDLHTQAIFVREPIGSRTNVFGETNRITLPNSALTVTYSSLWWQCSDPLDDRHWLAPNIGAPLTIAAYTANRDPALEAALSYQPGAMRFAEFPERLARQLRRLDLLPS